MIGSSSLSVNHFAVLYRNNGIIRGQERQTQGDQVKIAEASSDGNDGRCVGRFLQATLVLKRLAR